MQYSPARYSLLLVALLSALPAYADFDLGSALAILFGMALFLLGGLVLAIFDYRKNARWLSITNRTFFAVTSFFTLPIYFSEHILGTGHSFSDEILPFYWLTTLFILLKYGMRWKGNYQWLAYILLFYISLELYRTFLYDVMDEYLRIKNYQVRWLSYILRYTALFLIARKVVQDWRAKTIGNGQYSLYKIGAIIGLGSIVFHRLIQTVAFIIYGDFEAIFSILNPNYLLRALFDPIGVFLLLLWLVDRYTPSLKTTSE